MRRLALAPVVLLLLLLAAGPAAADGGTPPPHPEPVTVADLLADPEVFAGLLLLVRGELVGDFGKRADGSVWTQLNGDAYAEAPLRDGGGLAGSNLGIGVRFAAGVWPGFDRPGGYRVQGPIVELTGVWRYHDPERSGESYLEVVTVDLVAAARELPEPGFRWLPIGLGLGFLAAAGGITVVVRRRRG